MDSAGNYSINFHYSDSLGDRFWELITPSRKYQSAQQLLRKAQAIAADPVGNASYDRVSRGNEFYVRELFLSASPIKQLTFEYGGIGIERGENTEITSYDDDGYMVGGRVRMLEAGYASVDQHYNVFDNSRALDAYAWTLNGDSYGLGRRLIARSTFKVNPLYQLLRYVHSHGGDRLLQQE